MRETDRRAFLTLLGAGALAGATGTAAGGRAGRTTDRAGPPPAEGLGRADTGDGPRPGPSFLYDDPVTAPQFETDGRWQADSPRVSGAETYRDGEYVYQGWAYDDHGANTVEGPVPPESQPDSNSFGGRTGDLVYPTADRYAHNAADLLEFRAQPAGGGVRYRVTLTTMTEPDLAAVAVGIDTGSGSRTDWGHGLGDLGATVDHVLYVSGETALLDGEPVPASVDTTGNHIEVEVPLDPGTATWEHHLVAGLAEPDAPRFEQIRDQPTEDQPGGAQGQAVPPVFDVGFRLQAQEPMGAANVSFVDAGDGRLEPDAAAQEAEEATILDGRGFGYGHWREHAQALALADRDISAFGASIDFGALRRREDRRTVPHEGYLNLLYSSRHELGPGIENNVLRGRVQPYALYVPPGYDGSPAPLQVLLPATTSTYNMYGVAMPNLVQRLGADRDALVLVPEARGPDTAYRDEAELDVFEAINDVASRFAVDADRISVGGYSRGGHGTYNLASMYPDLFAAGFSIVGTPNASITNVERTDVTPVADNLRHVPLLLWAGMSDTVAPYPVIAAYAARLRELGYRHRLDSFPDYDHFRFAVEDEWGPGGAFLTGRRVERAPERITYRRLPARDYPRFGLVHDGAYWLDDIAVVDGADDGLVDAVSHADGYTPPVVEGSVAAATEPEPNLRQGVEWTEPLVAGAPANRLSLDCERVRALTCSVSRAGLETDRDLTLSVDATHPVTVRLVGRTRERTVEVPAGETERTVRFDERS